MPFHPFSSVTAHSPELKAIEEETTTNAPPREQQQQQQQRDRPQQHKHQTTAAAPPGHPEGGTYGEAEIEALREQAREEDEAKKQQDIPDEARTPKERLASAIHEYTEESSAEGSHGVHRTH